MALDVLFVSGNGSIISERPVAEIRDHEHEAIWRIAARSSAAFPMLSRIHDFYKDANYHTDDLAAFIAELESLREQGDELISGCLSMLIRVAREARERGFNLAFIAD